MKNKEDVRAFIRQEAMHAQAHNSANKEYLTIRNIDVDRNLKLMDLLFTKVLADKPLTFIPYLAHLSINGIYWN